MKIKYKVIAPLGLIAFLAAGCGSSTTSSTNYPQTTSSVPATDTMPAMDMSTTSPDQATSTAPAPADVNVSISNYAFSPATITIKKGTRVAWMNMDSVDHTVTGDNGGPASGNLAKGDSYSYTFNQTGTFSYHCAIHPYMKAKVIVTN